MCVFLKWGIPEPFYASGKRDCSRISLHHSKAELVWAFTIPYASSKELWLLMEVIGCFRKYWVNGWGSGPHEACSAHRQFPERKGLSFSLDSFHSILTIYKYQVWVGNLGSYSTVNKVTGLPINSGNVGGHTVPQYTGCPCSGIGWLGTAGPLWIKWVKWIFTQIKSVLSIMLIVKWSPCLYLNCWAFSLYFLPCPV